MQFSLPIVMLETKESIINIINESHLPMCIINEIITGIALEVKQKAQEELNIEKQKLQTETEQQE